MPDNNLRQMKSQAPSGLPAVNASARSKNMSGKNTKSCARTLEAVPDNTLRHMKKKAPAGLPCEC
eukprot:254724-Pelagomonas_calceolata.AAC.1